MRLTPTRRNRLAEPHGLAFSQSVETSGQMRFLQIGGQVPSGPAGWVPETFREQAQIVWQKLFDELAAADMAVTDLVKVTIYLSDRADAAENRAERLLALADARPALTVVIAQLMDPRWKIEVEATAMA